MLELDSLQPNYSTRLQFGVALFSGVASKNYKALTTATISCWNYRLYSAFGPILRGRGRLRLASLLIKTYSSEQKLKINPIFLHARLNIVTGRKFWSLCARDPRVWISASCRDSRHPPPQTNTPTACKSGSATVSVWSCERCGEWDPRHRRIQTSDSWCFCLTAVGFRLTRYAAGLSC